MIDAKVLLFANDSFYHAFTNRDLETMDDLWAREAQVSCIHPGWAALHGRDEVMEGWESILSNPASPEIFPYNARAYVLSASAYVTCYEKVPGGVLIATNLFIEEGGRLRLVHHQAAPCQDPPQEEDDDVGGMQ